MIKIIKVLLIISFILFPMGVSGTTLLPNTELQGTYVLVTYNLEVVLGDSVVVKLTSLDFSVYMNIGYQSSDEDKCATSPCWVSIGFATVLDPNKSKTFYVESGELIEGFTDKIKNQFTGVDITFRVLVKATSSTTSVLEELPFKIKISPSSSRSGLSYTLVALTSISIIIALIYFQRKRKRKNL